MVDGVNVMMNATQGLIVYNQLTLQEVVVETSGAGADRDSGALLMNLISKDGGNRFSGTAMFALASGGCGKAQLERGARQPRAEGSRCEIAEKLRDVGLAVGGPVRRDRLWFFGAFREGVENQQYAQGLYYNKFRQPDSYLYEPDLSKPAFTSGLAAFTVRLTLQAAAKHKVVVASSSQPNCNCVYDLLPPQSSACRKRHGGAVRQIISPAGPGHFSGGRVVRSRRVDAHHRNERAQHRLPLYRLADVPQTDIRIEDQGLNLIYGSVRCDVAASPISELFSVAYVTGSHNSKVGLMLRQSLVGDVERYGHDLFMHGTAVQYRLNTNHVPNRLTLLDGPWGCRKSTCVTSRSTPRTKWTIRKLTLNLGVRYSDAKGSTPEQVLPAGFWVPERRLEPTDDNPHWRNLSPRVGGAYDLFGTGRTAVKAAIGHYPDRVRDYDKPREQSDADDVHHMERPQWELSTRLQSAKSRGRFHRCGYLRAMAKPDLRPAPYPVTTYSKEATEGFNKQSHHWQGSLSVQHELRPGIGLNVGYFRTWYGGFLVTDNPTVDPTSYNPSCITAHGRWLARWAR